MNPVQTPILLFRRGLVRLVPAVLCLSALLLLPVSLTAKPVEFGESYIFAECLHIVAESYLGRQGDVGNHDWVTMRVTNNCAEPLKHLQVALILFDAGGAPYGAAVWLLERGIYLPPGKSRIKKVAVPDPDNRIAVRWEARVLQVSRALAGRRKRK